MKNEIELKSDSLEDFEKLIQIIPKELLDALKQEAKAQNINIDIEVSTRLYLTFLEPNAFGFSAQFDNLMNNKFEISQARREIEMRRRAWLMIYELDKLRLFITLEDKLPKQFKEKFTLIDVEKESIKIRKELANKDKDDE